MSFTVLFLALIVGLALVVFSKQHKWVGFIIMAIAGYFIARPKNNTSNYIAASWMPGDFDRQHREIFRHL